MGFIDEQSAKLARALSNNSKDNNAVNKSVHLKKNDELKTQQSSNSSVFSPIPDLDLYSVHPDLPFIIQEIIEEYLIGSEKQANDLIEWFKERRAFPIPQGYLLTKAALDKEISIWAKNKSKEGEKNTLANERAKKNRKERGEHSIQYKFMRFTMNSAEQILYDLRKEKQYKKSGKPTVEWPNDLYVPGNWCGTGVSYIFKNATGIIANANGKDWDSIMDNLIKNRYLPFMRHKYDPTKSDMITNGSIAVWKYGNFGHVAIKIGNKWVSDYLSNTIKGQGVAPNMPVCYFSPKILVE